MAPSSFHPDLRRAAMLVPRHVVGPRSLPAIRKVIGLAARRQPAGITLDHVGDVPLRVHRPPGATVNDPGPGILWIHGGGFVMGAAAQDDDGCGDLARRLGAVVVAVDYRLAPEHPHPAPLEDCHAALEWLAAQPDVDESRIAIAGASAGGGLAAGLAIMAAERGVVAPAFQLLLYPMLDDRSVDLPAEFDERDVRLWDRASNRFGWQSYLGVPAGSPDVPATAAPARSDALHGLPPAWIGVGTLDLFHREDVAYAGRLRSAEVDCELVVVPGAFHAFDMVQRARVVRDFRASQLAALSAALGVPGVD